MNETPRIAILLTTFNGASYLAAQLDSLLAQTWSNFVVVVRDDGSIDDTPALIESYQARNPDRFHLVADTAGNKGASASFSCLMEHALEHKTELGLDRAYLMFCDQDDIWLPEKIEREMTAMLAAEGGDRTLPVLVHSDLQVVSATGEMIAPSFVRFQGLELERNSLEGLVFSNLVTGCTALCNEALALKSGPVAKHAIMHDWWLALVATAFGRLVYLDTPLVHYRQHGDNTIGAQEHRPPKRRTVSFWTRLFTMPPNDLLGDVAVQAEDFYARFARQLTRRQRLALRLAIAMRVRWGLYQRLLQHLARRL